MLGYHGPECEELPARAPAAGDSQGGYGTRVLAERSASKVEQASQGPNASFMPCFEIPVGVQVSA